MRTQRTNGFTLLELMIAVAILGVIAAIAIPAYNGYIMTSHKTECQNEIAAIKLAESEFFLDNNLYFQGNTAADLGTASGGIYVPSPNLTECEYKVVAAATSYTITASPKIGGHLVGQGNIVVSGP